MLQLMRRAQATDLRALPADDDQALRRAFGRYADSASREDGARVVREHQGRQGGQWFACDCLGGASPPPVLVPVAENHIRRHVEPPWPQHAGWCDFYRSPEEQSVVSASFRRPDPGDNCLRLVRAFASEEPLECRFGRAGADRRRPRLATLMFDLLERSGLTRIEPGHAPSIADQFKALRKAAETVEVDAGLPLSRFFCAYPPALPEFVERLGRIPEMVFRRSHRPHGILMGVVARAARGQIVPILGSGIDVAGAISIFGESDGHAVGRDDVAGERAPYLMTAVFGRRHPDEPVEVLRAYLHPVMSPTWLLPVDSNHERSTVRQLLSLRRWLAAKRRIALSIEKPVFDLATPRPSPRGEDAGPREPIIPDFIARGSSGRTVIVETMGYDQPAYRERKQRLHREMSRLCGGASVIEHDFCEPHDQPQNERDRSFWSRCRWAITGPEDRPRAGRDAQDSVDAVLLAHSGIHPS
jgi:hypothetical protein